MSQSFKTGENASLDTHSIENNCHETQPPARHVGSISRQTQFNRASCWNHNGDQDQQTRFLRHVSLRAKVDQLFAFKLKHKYTPQFNVQCAIWVSKCMLSM